MLDPLLGIMYHNLRQAIRLLMCLDRDLSVRVQNIDSLLRTSIMYILHQLIDRLF